MILAAKIRQKATCIWATVLLISKLHPFLDTLSAFYSPASRLFCPTCLGRAPVQLWYNGPTELPDRIPDKLLNFWKVWFLMIILSISVYIEYENHSYFVDISFVVLVIFVRKLCSVFVCGSWLPLQNDQSDRSCWYYKEHTRRLEDIYCRHWGNQWRLEAMHRSLIGT